MFVTTKQKIIAFIIAIITGLVLSRIIYYIFDINLIKPILLGSIFSVIITMNLKKTK